jgi:hypothetical protein
MCRYADLQGNLACPMLVSQNSAGAIKFQYREGATGRASSLDRAPNALPCPHLQIHAFK